MRAKRRIASWVRVPEANSLKISSWQTATASVPRSERWISARRSAWGMNSRAATISISGALIEWRFWGAISPAKVTLWRVIAGSKTRNVGAVPSGAAPARPRVTASGASASSEAGPRSRWRGASGSVTSQTVSEGEAPSRRNCCAGSVREVKVTVCCATGSEKSVERRYVIE